MPWINIEYIQRLVRRFLLQNVALRPEAVFLNPNVQAVTDINSLLFDSKAATNILDLSAAAGTYVPFHEVPTGKRWRVRHIARSVTTANSAVMAVIGGGTINFTNNGTAQEIVSGLDFIMEQGDTIGMNTTGNGGDTTRWLRILYEEEEAFALT